jgi:hypothetical protein
LEIMIFRDLFSRCVLLDNESLYALSYSLLKYMSKHKLNDLILSSSEDENSRVSDFALFSNSDVNIDQ